MARQAKVIRCENGPEYISGVLLSWAAQQGIRIERQRRALQPSRAFRLAGPNLFEPIEQVPNMAIRWLWTYNHERPNIALGGISPMQEPMLAA